MSHTLLHRLAGSGDLAGTQLWAALAHQQETRLCAGQPLEAVAARLGRHALAVSLGDCYAGGAAMPRGRL